ncbi:hypothetical protein B0H17DRAFT_1106295, partial [Mycena rosella]
MRYGVDDPCLWPQQFSPRFQHLPAISKREARPEIDVMCTMTTRLGKLAHHQFTRFVKPYCASVPRENTANISATPYYLELDALLSYTQIYKPRMESCPTSLHGPASFWLLRPTAAFFGENILAIAPLGKPHLATRWSTVGSADAKIEAMSRATQQVPWYKDPFSNEGSEKVTEGSPSQAGPQPRPEQEIGDHVVQVYSPYRGSRHQAKVPAPGSGGRDNGRSAPQFRCCADKFYVFPEPASPSLRRTPTATPDVPPHWMLLRDACLYVRSQEWRDILAKIAHILGPALRACGIDRMHGYPAAPESIGVTSLAKAKQMIWDIAETNFRFELAALDDAQLWQQVLFRRDDAGDEHRVEPTGVASPWLE